jgi:hypothetical protein
VRYQGPQPDWPRCDAASLTVIYRLNSMPTARRTWLIASLGTYDARVWAHSASISGSESLCPEINSMVISNQTSVQCRRYTMVSSTKKRALRFVDQWITGSAVVSASSLSLRLSRRSCPSSAGGLPRWRCSGRDQARPARQVVARRRTSAGRCTTNRSVGGCCSTSYSAWISPVSAVTRRSPGGRRWRCASGSARCCHGLAGSGSEWPSRPVRRVLAGYPGHRPGRRVAG